MMILPVLIAFPGPSSWPLRRRQGRHIRLSAERRGETAQIPGQLVPAGTTRAPHLEHVEFRRAEPGQRRVRPGIAGFHAMGCLGHPQMAADRAQGLTLQDPVTKLGQLRCLQALGTLQVGDYLSAQIQNARFARLPLEVLQDFPGGGARRRSSQPFP